MIDREFVQCYEFSSSIQNTSSRVKKASILLYNRNDCISHFLNFLLDANITTGISTARINRKLSSELDPNISMSFFDVCRYISNNPSNDKTFGLHSLTLKGFAKRRTVSHSLSLQS